MDSSSRTAERLWGELAAEVAIDRLWEDLPAAAQVALEAGWDTPALIQLAGLAPGELDQAHDLLTRALDELGIFVPGREEAVLRLARFEAERILDGEVSAYEGAKRIWNLALRAPDGHLAQLDTFVYAASEWDRRPDDGNVFAEGVFAAARDLVS